MKMMTPTTVSAQTAKRTITLTNGTVTMTGSQEPLEPEESLQLFEVLCIWRYGLEIVADDLDANAQQRPEM